MEFETGEIVQIKSGGPFMTVVSADEAGVHCLWYGDATEEVRTAVVPGVALQAATIIEDEDEEEEAEDDEEGDEHEHGKKKSSHKD